MIQTQGWVLNEENEPVDLEEKPTVPKSSYATVFICMRVVSLILKSIKPSDEAS